MTSVIVVLKTGVNARLAEEELEAPSVWPQWKQKLHHGYTVHQTWHLRERINVKYMRLLTSFPTRSSFKLLNLIPCLRGICLIC